MQPRSDLWPLRGETVFQVTKRGCSSVFGTAGEGCLERPKEKKDELDEDLELPPRAALEEDVEREVEGVEDEEEAEAGESACKRDMLGSWRAERVNRRGSGSGSESGSWMGRSSSFPSSSFRLSWLWKTSWPS